LNVPENKVKHSIKSHAAYHILFYNLLPEEIGQYLAKEWWNNEYCVVVERRNSRLCFDLEKCGRPNFRKREFFSVKEQFTYFLMFRGLTPEEILAYLVEEWWGNHFNVFIAKKEEMETKEKLFQLVRTSAD
jgi:hypothetical protein